MFSLSFFAVTKLATFIHRDLLCITRWLKVNIFLKGSNGELMQNTLRTEPFNLSLGQGA